MSLIFDRRRLLIGLATASAAAAAPVAISAAVPVVPAENGELLRLGDALPAVAEAYFAAATAEWDVLSTWGPRLPRAPMDIRQTHGRHDDIERTLSGWAAHDEGSERLIYVTAASWFTYLRKGGESALSRKRRTPLSAERVAELTAEIAEHRRLETLALDYEEGRARVIEASGFEAAKAERKATLEALRDLVGAIMAEQPEGMAGVIVQAQAIAAWGQVPLMDQVLATVGTTTGLWANSLASTVLRIASA